jgi:hypothetical protein
VEFCECPRRDLGELVHPQVEEFERLHRFESVVFDERDAVVGEIDALDQQQVPEERAVQAFEPVVSQPHDLDAGLAPERVVM